MKAPQTLVMAAAFLLAYCLQVTAQSTLQNGLRAHYRFNGNLLDETSYDHDLHTTLGTASYTTVSAGDQALSLNGMTTVSSLDIFSNSDWEKMAISLWFKIPDVTNDLQIILQGAYIGFGIYAQANNGKVLGFFDGSSADSYESSDSLTDNNWHHMVIQTNGTFTEMYVNGVYDGGRSENIFVGNGGQNNRLFLGRSNFNQHWFSGEVNELRIYNRTLKITEIQELAASPLASIASESEPKNLILFPNPTDDFLTVILPVESAETVIYISDLSGRVIFQERTFSGSQFTIQPQISPGVYVLAVKTESTTYSAKFIKN